MCLPSYFYHGAQLVDSMPGVRVGMCVFVYACLCECSPGFICPTPGSTTPTPIKCLAGTYSNAGATSCTNCAAGQYGATDGLQSSACSGFCAAGTFSADGAVACGDCNVAAG